MYHQPPNVQKEANSKKVLIVSLLLDLPVVSCSWSSGDSLVVSGLEFPSVPCLDKARKQLPCRLGRQIIEVSALLLFQPCGKLVVLREVVLTC